MPEAGWAEAHLAASYHATELNRHISICKFHTTGATTINYQYYSAIINEAY